MQHNTRTDHTINLLAVCLSIQFCIYKSNAMICNMLSEWIADLGVSETTTLHSVLIESAALVLYLLAFLLPLWLFFSLSKTSAAILRLSPTLPLQPFYTFSFAAALILISLTALGHLSHLIPQLPPSPISVPQGTVPLFFCFLRSVILPAFVAEIFLRGFVLHELLPWGRTFAIFFCAGIGALLADNLTLFALYAVIGAVSGYFVTHTGSLWIGVFISLICNTLCFLYSFSVAEDLTARSVALHQIFIMGMFLLGVFSCIKIDDQIRQSKINPVSSDRKKAAITCLAAPCMIAYYILILIYF